MISGYPLTHIYLSSSVGSYSCRMIEEVARRNLKDGVKSFANKFQHNHFIIQEGAISLPLFTFALKQEIEPEYVCWILERIGEASLSAIEPVLNHSSPVIRNRLASLLGSIHTTDSLTLLRRMRYDSDPSVKKTARSFLTVIRNKDRSSAGLLTSREMEVLRWVSAGASNGQIGAKLYISESTVKTHMARIFRKLGFTSRIEAVLYYKEIIEEKNTTSRE